MNDCAIEVGGLSKLYRIGGEQKLYPTLRESVAGAITSRFRRNGNGAKSNAREFWALKDVNFQVQRGEVVGIIGRNGAGKSTLLKILSRITDPTEGEIEIDGRVGSLLEVGTGFHPELTGRENVFLNGAILGMKRREIAGKFDEIVAFAETEKFLDTPVKFYSSGMYTRLAFAVAAHLEPEILIVDEVLAVGDASFQKKCLGKMNDVSKQGRTVLFVSHNMTALRSLCTRAVWLENGKVMENGHTTDVVGSYMRKNTIANPESVWSEGSAPGDDRIRLRSVRLISRSNSTDQITVHTPLSIEFTYWNTMPGAVLNISALLYTSEEICVLVTVSDFRPRAVGLIRHILEIPGDFLNANSYFVNMLIVKDASVPILRQDNVLSFDVVEGEVTGNWYGATPGTVRPKLVWKSEAVDASEIDLATARAQSD
ncbi:MAG TPA: ABC transporter ATP-binding protein [Candidatus Acidoferrales bacterium]|nr:ABC transporter ATP-binding protein [Candidatus Acidoferrales bacterium]